MRTAIVLASVVADPESVARTADRLHGEMDTVIVCRDGQRLDVSEAAEYDHRIVVDHVPDGGPVAAMRAGFRAARTRTAFVTTPGTPQLEPDTLPTLSPGVEADATLARIEGSKRPPCGGYVIDPAREACDTTLAMGSRRVSDVLARLTTTIETVEATSRVTAAAGTAAASTN